MLAARNARACPSAPPSSRCVFRRGRERPPSSSAAQHQRHQLPRKLGRAPAAVMAADRRTRPGVERLQHPRTLLTDSSTKASPAHLAAFAPHIAMTRRQSCRWKSFTIMAHSIPTDTTSSRPRPPTTGSQRNRPDLSCGQPSRMHRPDGCQPTSLRVQPIPAHQRQQYRPREPPITTHHLSLLATTSSRRPFSRTHH